MRRPAACSSSSNRDNVIDKQIYALALDGSSADKPAAHHQGRRLARGGVLAQRRSVRRHLLRSGDAAADVDPQAGRLDGRLARAQRAERAAIRTPSSRPTTWPTEYGTLKANDGQTLYYSMIKPSHFNAGQALSGVPVDLRRPARAARGAQVGQQLFDQYMAQQGYVVFRLDNRGSSPPRARVHRRHLQGTGQARSRRPGRRHRLAGQAEVRRSEAHRRVRLELRRLHDACACCRRRRTRSRWACRLRR